MLFRSARETAFPRASLQSTSFICKPTPSPHPTPPPLSSSHTLGHCSSAPTTPAPGTRQPQMAPTPQSPMRLFPFAPPKPADPALPSPPTETTVKTSAHIYYSLSLPLTDAGASSPRGPHGGTGPLLLGSEFTCGLIAGCVLWDTAESSLLPPV